MLLKSSSNYSLPGSIMMSIFWGLPSQLALVCCNIPSRLALVCCNIPNRLDGYKGGLFHVLWVSKTGQNQHKENQHNQANSIFHIVISILRLCKSLSGRPHDSWKPTIILRGISKSQYYSSVHLFGVYAGSGLIGGYTDTNMSYSYCQYWRWFHPGLKEFIDHYIGPSRQTVRYSNLGHIISRKFDPAQDRQIPSNGKLATRHHCWLPPVRR